MNTKRILLGGLPAGLIVFVSEAVLWGFVLADVRLIAHADLGLPEPPDWGIPLLFASTILMGLLLAWLNIPARKLVMDHLEPILWRRMDVRPYHRYAHNLGTLSRADAEAVSDVPVDPERIGVLAARLYWQQHLIREFDGPRRETQRILTLIDRALE